MSLLEGTLRQDKVSNMENKEDVGRTKKSRLPGCFGLETLTAGFKKVQHVLLSDH